jgi:hypothetical protein
MTTVGFLILDDIHHIHHLAPIAFELSRRPGYDCTIFIQAHSRSILQSVSTQYPQHRCRIQTLAPLGWTRLKYQWQRKICRSARVIRDHIDALLRHDVVISADLDMDELIIHSKNLSKKPLFFAIPHGAGDRDRGADYPAAVQALDFMLLPGNKYQRRLADYLRPDHYAVIGYPKFDVISDRCVKLFAEDKPTVLYNPHFSLEDSSWPRWGLEILDYFYQQRSYYCIFAPHRNLFNRLLKSRCLPKKYFQAPHLLIDTGSEKSVDMTYTQAADIYLGDVSSQVYEFIRRPKPCFFLNAHDSAWQNNPRYLCWRLGTVVDHLPDLWAQLAVHPQPNPYADLQRQWFTDTFSITAESAAVRGANAIHNYVRRQR